MALRSRVSKILGSKILALKYKESLQLATKRLAKRSLLPSKKLNQEVVAGEQENDKEVAGSEGATND